MPAELPAGTHVVYTDGSHTPGKGPHDEEKAGWPSSLFLLYLSPVQFADFAPVQFDDGLLGMPPVPRPNPPESV